MPVRMSSNLGTESFGNPVKLASRITSPGASAHKRLLVREAQTTEGILLRLMRSPWTMTTGRRYPGADPTGSDKSAHQISPLLILTIRFALES
jgi:hypothetical protein